MMSQNGQDFNGGMVSSRWNACFFGYPGAAPSHKSAKRKHCVHLHLRSITAQQKALAILSTRAKFKIRWA
jgi:hypothetical protein